MLRVVLIMLLLGGMGGCSKIPFLYRADIQQGNTLTQEQMQAVKPGMSEEQVRYLLGSPVLTTLLPNDASEYIYTYQPGDGKMQVRRVTVSLHKGMVAKVVQHPTLEH